MWQEGGGSLFIRSTLPPLISDTLVTGLIEPTELVWGCFEINWRAPTPFWGCVALYGLSLSGAAVQNIYLNVSTVRKICSSQYIQFPLASQYFAIPNVDIFALFWVSFVVGALYKVAPDGGPDRRDRDKKENKQTRKGVCSFNPFPSNGFIIEQKTQNSYWLKLSQIQVQE